MEEGTVVDMEFVVDIEDVDGSLIEDGSGENDGYDDVVSCDEKGDDICLEDVSIIFIMDISLSSFRLNRWGHKEVYAYGVIKRYMLRICIHE